jgi:hypothetical protein
MPLRCAIPFSGGFCPNLTGGVANAEEAGLPACTYALTPM